MSDLEEMSAELDHAYWERDDALHELELTRRDLDANVRLLEEKEDRIADLEAECEYLKRQLGVLD